MTGLTAHLVKLHRRAQSLTSQETELETDQSDNVDDKRMETTPRRITVRRERLTLWSKISATHRDTHSFCARLDGQRSRLGHIVELRPPRTNLSVGVYCWNFFLFTFLNNYKASLFLLKQTVLAIQCTGTFTRSSAGSLNGPRKAAAPIYR